MSARALVLVAAVSVGASAAGAPIAPGELLATDLRGETVSAAQSEALGTLLADYREEPRGPVLAPARLSAFLAEADWTDPTDPFLARLLRWVAEQVRQQGFDLDWLREFASAPGSAFEWISRISMVLIIGIAAYLVVRELRHVRYPRRRRVHAAPLSGRAQSPVPLVAIATLHPRERPAAALRVVLSVLSGQGRALAGHAATHRDIAQRAHRLGVDRGGALVQLADLAERARYGAWDARDGSHDVVGLAERALGGLEDPRHGPAGRSPQRGHRARSPGCQR